MKKLLQALLATSILLVVTHTFGGPAHAEDLNGQFHALLRERDGLDIERNRLAVEKERLNEEGESLSKLQTQLKAWQEGGSKEQAEIEKERKALLAMAEAGIKEEEELVRMHKELGNLLDRFEKIDPFFNRLSKDIESFAREEQQLQVLAKRMDELDDDELYEYEKRLEQYKRSIVDTDARIKKYDTEAPDSAQAIKLATEYTRRVDAHYRGGDEIEQRTNDWQARNERFTADGARFQAEGKDFQHRATVWQASVDQYKQDDTKNQEQLTTWQQRYDAYTKSLPARPDEERQKLEKVSENLRVADKSLKWLTYGTTIAAVLKLNPDLSTAAQFFSRMSDTNTGLVMSLDQILKIEDTIKARVEARRFSEKYNGSNAGLEEKIVKLDRTIASIKVGVVPPRHDFAVTANLMRTQPDEAFSRLKSEAELIRQNISELTELIAVLREIELRSKGASTVSRAVSEGLTKANEHGGGVLGSYILLTALEFDNLAKVSNGVASSAAAKITEAEQVLATEKQRFENMRTNLKTFWNMEITTE
jgi:hypothetical protein